jgi:hypothetical protein
MFSSAVPLSTQAIAACAKAIALDAGTSIENMVAKQLDENDIAKQITYGMHVEPVNTESNKIEAAVAYIGNKFESTLKGASRSATAFASSLAMYVVTEKFTGQDQYIFECIKILKSIPLDVIPAKIRMQYGITKEIFGIIQRVI